MTHRLSAITHTQEYTVLPGVVRHTFIIFSLFTTPNLCPPLTQNPGDATDANGHSHADDIQVYISAPIASCLRSIHCIRSLNVLMRGYGHQLDQLSSTELSLLSAKVQFSTTWQILASWLTVNCAWPNTVHSSSVDKPCDALVQCNGVVWTTS